MAKESSVNVGAVSDADQQLDAAVLESKPLPEPAVAPGSEKDGLVALVARLEAQYVTRFDKELERRYPKVAAAIRDGGSILHLSGPEVSARSDWRTWHRFHKRRWAIDVMPAEGRRRLDRLNVWIGDRPSYEVVTKFLAALARTERIAGFEWRGGHFPEDGGTFEVRIGKGLASEVAKVIAAELVILAPGPAEQQ
ncbi:MAG TPA: hypothetical protein VFE22_15700 [Edaphobacter sp.]|nr:hypothetical protein [Edaphobacter sp.]